jgi:hypothetical protein
VIRGSWFVVRGSWFVVRGSWFVVRGSWFVVRGQRITCGRMLVYALRLTTNNEPRATNHVRALAS